WWTPIGLFAVIGPSRNDQRGLPRFSSFRFSKMPCWSQNARIARSKAGKSTFWVSTRANEPSVGPGTSGFAGSGTADTPRNRFAGATTGILQQDTRPRHPARATRTTATVDPTCPETPPQSSRYFPNRTTNLSNSHLDRYTPQNFATFRFPCDQNCRLNCRYLSLRHAHDNPER